MDLNRLTLCDLQEMLGKRDVTSMEVTKSIFARIKAVDARVGAFISLCEDKALENAEKADIKIKEGKQRSLTGIPVAVKDNICIREIKTTCGSRILENYESPYDATVIKRLREEFSVFVGKTNMDEFGMGSSTETSYFGVTRNPWDFDRIPGGSSGGSAGAVAADECIVALGSDTGGSIRQPAACCGVVGLKPTYGRVSRFGLVAFASSLDQIGTITKNVQDSAILLTVISGHDSMDSTSVERGVPDFKKALDMDVKGMRIGIPKEYFREGIDPEVEQSVRNAVKELEKLGAISKDISLPYSENAVAVYYLIAPAEASSNLARYDGVKYGHRTSNAKGLNNMYGQTRSDGFGKEVKRRIMLGTYSLSAGYYDAYYGKASQVRTLIKRDFEEAFKECDIIVTPTAPAPAFKIGEKMDDPLQMYLFDIYTIPANLAGIPAISIPCGFSRKSLPIGLQLLGKHFDEAGLLRVAYAFEQHTDYHLKKPIIPTE